MKYAWSTILMLFAVIASVSASADAFDDYRIPPHDLIDWRLQLRSNGFRFFQDDAYNATRSRTVSGEASSAFSWLSDSDPLTTEVFASAAALGQTSWRHEDTRSVFSPFVDERSLEEESRIAVENWLVGLEHRRYPFRSPIGASLSVAARGSYSQQWLDDRSDVRSGIDTMLIRDVSLSSRTIWVYQTQISSQLTIGVGQVRDASSIYEARLLESRLLDAGALARPLSDGARQKLVALLATRFAYEVLRERPAKALWQKIEEILQEDGAIGERGLDPYAVLRAGERHTGGGLTPDDLPQSPVIRRVGFFAGPALLDRRISSVVRIDDSNFSQRTVNDSTVLGPSTMNSGSRSESKRDETFLGLSGEYHRPLGLHWQADLDGAFFVPTRASMDGNMGTASGRMSWMVADHWEASASARYERVMLTDGNRDDDRWWWNYGVSGTWYIQDRLALTLSAREQQQQVGDDSFFRDGFFSLALTYRILGGFGAPGLIPHEAL